MEAEQAPWKKAVLPSGFLLLALLLAGKAADLLWLRPRGLERRLAGQGIRGPPYRFLYGNAKELLGLMVAASSRPLSPKWSHDVLPRVLPFYTHWRTIYGSIFLLWFGPTARVVVSDPDLVREILVSRSDCYEKYDAHPAIRRLEGRGLLNLRGAEWARRRKLLSPAFHLDNLKLLAPLIGRTALDTVDKWMIMSEAGGKAETDVAEWYRGLTFDVITKTAFTANYDDGEAIFRLQCQQMSHAIESLRSTDIPGYRFLPTRKNMDSWKLNKEVNKRLVRLIGSRARAYHKHDNHNREEASVLAPRDLLSYLLTSGSDGAAERLRSRRPGDHRGGPPAHAITVEEMVEECKTFFFAGTHTTAYLLTWSTLMLAMHPEWQEWAREEVLRVCGECEPPTRAAVLKIKTLGMILNETLRLYPPVVAMIRRAKVDVVLGRRHEIPGGTEIMLPIMAIHHDPELWGPDCREFKPTRFSDGPARAARHPTAFMPFGLGPRTCLGQNLALLEAKLTLAVVLQRFTIVASPSYVHAPAVLMLLYPQHGAPVVFRRRPGW